MDLEIQTKQPLILRIVVIFPAISIAILVLRLYSRYLSRRFGMDDFLAIIATCIAVAAGYSSYQYTKLHWQGYHDYDIPMQTFSYQRRAGIANFINQILYNPILVLVRASIVFFILSLKHLSKKVRWNLYAINTINVAFFFAVLFGLLFQCHPFHYVYDKNAMDSAAREAAGAGPDGRVNGELVFGGSCVDRPVFYILAAIISILLDFWLLAIPSAMVWGINMPKTQKTVVVTVLSFWVISTIFGIVRLAFVAPSWVKSGVSDIEDSRYSETSSFHWIEANLSIWTAAAPALKPLISKMFPRWWKDTIYEKASSNAGQPRLSPAPPGSPTESPRGSFSYQEFPHTRRPTPRQAVPSPQPGYSHRGITQSQIELNRFEHDIDLATLDRSLFRDTPEGVTPVRDPTD